jgi:hypothetical protein
MRRTALSATVLLAVLAGCGGSSSSGTSTADFKKQYAPIDAQLKAAGTELGTAFKNATKKTDAQLAAELDAVTAHLDAATAKLAKLDPPNKVKDDFASARKQFDQVHADLVELTAAVRAHSSPRSKAGAEKTVSDSAVLKPTLNRIRRAVGLKESP